MKTKPQFKGLVAIVTGGASGIGESLAREFARRGGIVVIADRQEAAGRQVVQAIRDSGGSARFMELDVRKLKPFQQVVQATVDQYGRVDYLFNNAGILVSGEIAEYANRDWTEVFDVNIKGVSNGIQAVYPLMIRQGFGHIVNTASVAGLVSTPAMGSYTASKHAVVGMTKALRVEARRYGVRASALCPGVVHTPIVDGGAYGRVDTDLTDQEKLAKLRQIRAITPDQLATAALDQIARNVGIIVIPEWYKWAWRIERLSPGLSELFAGLLFKRLEREAGWKRSG